MKCGWSFFKIQNWIKMFYFLSIFAFFSTCHAREAIVTERFIFDEHEYIHFEGKGILHDPECHCHDVLEGYFIDRDGKYNSIIIISGNKQFRSLD